MELTISGAAAFFADQPKIARSLELLEEVGLGYLRVGQGGATLSGGEAQRLELAAELVRASGTGNLYLLDEPTTGLHFDDVERLATLLHRLADAGHTVVVVEHNADLIRQADWVIELGPEGGEGGGRVVDGGCAQLATA
jgi:excinuclease ABC subunit A